jgi:hypothetical protein
VRARLRLGHFVAMNPLRMTVTALGVETSGPTEFPPLAAEIVLQGSSAAQPGQARRPPSFSARRLLNPHPRARPQRHKDRD